MSLHSYHFIAEHRRVFSIPIENQLPNELTVAVAFETNQRGLDFRMKGDEKLNGLLQIKFEVSISEGADNGAGFKFLTMNLKNLTHSSGKLKMVQFVFGDDIDQKDEYFLNPVVDVDEPVVDCTYFGDDEYFDIKRTVHNEKLEKSADDLTEGSTDSCTIPPRA